MSRCQENDTEELIKPQHNNKPFDFNSPLHCHLSLANIPNPGKVLSGSHHNLEE